MAHMFEHVMGVLARPPAGRSDVDVNGMLPWMRRRTELFPQLDKDTSLKILKYCNYETVEKDDIIIRQGEEGDQMYIILRGSISVYIDASLTGEEPGDPFLSPMVSPTLNSPTGQTTARSTKLDRAHFGKFIIKYEAGKHFGEAALVGGDKTRNATIMADEDCDLLVIGQKLFDSSLKEHQQREVSLLVNFVEKHPLFCHMSPKYKRLLELSLRRQNFAFETTIYNQGDKHKALYFILSGQAKVLIEPGKHQKQYTHLWPFELGTDIYSQEFDWLRESRKTSMLRKYEDPAVWPTKSEALVVRREQGYAASEKSIAEKTVTLCSIQQGEVLGDTEIVHNLKTYMNTVVCTANTETIVLDVKNLERVTGRRNLQTMELMKANVIEKLDLRHRTFHGQQVPFLKYLYDKLTELELPEKKALPPLKLSKTLPSKEIQNQHMLERFTAGKGELLDSCVPGTLIYKEMMEEKTRIRTNIRRRSQAGPGSLLRETRRKMNRRKPRSRREIVNALKEMIEAELVDAGTPGQQQKPQQGGSKAGGRPGQPGMTPRPGQDTPRGRAFITDGGRRPEAPQEDRPPRKLNFQPPEAGSTPRKQGTGPSPNTTPRRSSLTLSEPSPRRASITSSEGGANSTISAPALPLIGQGDSGAGPVKKSSLKGGGGGSKGGEKKRVTLPPVEGEKGKDKKGVKKDTGGKGEEPGLPRSRSGSLSLPQILEEREEMLMSRESTQLSLTSREDSARYVKREVRATTDDGSLRGGSGKRLPPLAKVEVRRPGHVPSDRWETALRFVNDRMNDRFTEQLLSEGSPAQQDYETSEASLTLLEGRIKQFHVKHGQFSPVRLNLKLPKLRRFKLDLEDEEQQIPKPGGKVWIKKRMCQIANSKFKVKGHEHIRYHMVPELPEFDAVKKMQTVMQQLLDNSVLRKQQEEAKAEEETRKFNRRQSVVSDAGSEHRLSFV